MRSLWILLLAGCGGRLVIPLYDEVPVLTRHPALRGKVLTADTYVPKASGTVSGDEKITVLGMVSYEGDIPLSEARTLSRSILLAGSPSALACLPQIIVVRPCEGTAIVCDYYRFLQDKDSRQDLPLRSDDILVVPELYNPDQVPCAPEWVPINDFLLGKLDRSQLVQALHK